MYVSSDIHHDSAPPDTDAAYTNLAPRSTQGIRSFVGRKASTKPKGPSTKDDVLGSLSFPLRVSSSKGSRAPVLYDLNGPNGKDDGKDYGSLMVGWRFA